MDRHEEEKEDVAVVCTCSDLSTPSSCLAGSIGIINHGQRPWYWEGPPRGPST